MITTNTKNIIVADDSEFFRVKLSDILTEAGHRVHIVRGGLELIEEIRINPGGIDMILLDLQMPGVDGFGVLEWINNNGLIGKFHILAITGVYEATAVMDRLRKLGVEGLMTKAFTPEEIIFRVNRSLFPDKAVLRAEPRVPVSIPVDFTMGEVTLTGYLLNISSSGIFLHTKKTLSPETFLRIRFTLPGSNTLLNLRGVVRWCTQTGGEKNLFGGVGIQFLNLSPEEEQMLKEFVDINLKKFDLQVADES